MNSPIENDDSSTLQREDLEVEPGDGPGGDAERSGPRGSLITWAVALGVVLALFALGAFTSRTHEIDPATELAEPLPVVIIGAELVAGYEVERSFIGRVEAKRASDLGFELAGLVTQVRVEEGDIVAKGELLATLDTARLEARRRSLEAQLQQAEADATLAELTRGRVSEAQDLDAISPQALDEAELGLKASQAARQRARAALDEIDVELAKSRLLAPYDAVIAGRSVDEGRVLGAGTPVLRVLERGSPEARVGVAGEVIKTLAVGQRHLVKVGGRDIPATVIAVLPVRRPGTRSIEVLLELESELVHAQAADGAVHAGDLARLLIKQRLETPGFWLPSSALSESSRGLWAIYVITGDGQEGALERRELEVLHQEADRVFVRGTLQDGERVVSRGLHRLVPGQRVRIHPGSHTDGEKSAS